MPKIIAFSPSSFFHVSIANLSLNLTYKALYVGAASKG
jgi:hypothetical protein